SKGISTETLLQIQESIQKQQESKGRMYKSRAVVRRLSQQKEELVQLAKTIHHGSKQDFLSALAHSVTTSTCSSSNSLIQDEDWDGSLTPQDILASAPYHYHLSTSDVLDIQDTTSATEIVRALRRKLPGFLDSERKVNGVKAKYMKEFEILWKPERTHSGWQINPQRLRETLQYLYWWLPESEWWKIYGDGRNFGGKDSVALTLNTVNDEAMFNGVAYHSPEEYWPITIFYGKDTRLNLELNLGDPHKEGSLNKWIQTMQENRHKIYLSSDSKFSDNILGGGLDPTSDDSFTMYNYETKQTRSEVGFQTGLRSELCRRIEREHPESLLPSLPTTHYIPDGNHCFCRLTEHMVFDRCMSCLNLESQPSMGPAVKDQTLGHFLSNINARGVRNGTFQLHFEGKKLEQVTLNFDLPGKLREHLNWPTPQISEYDLETMIWRVHWEMHELERLDEDPRKYVNRLKPGIPHGSSDPKDYRFGLTEEEIQKYEELADLHHALTLLRYGSSKLYPYLMKRVDVFPQMLRELPFHSLFRGGTEGSERTHYLHQCLYFGHSARGGGWKCQDPIITLFRWYYRFFRRRLAKCPATVQEAFNQYVKEKFEEAGLDHTEEMSTADNQPPFSDQNSQLVEPNSVSEQIDCSSQPPSSSSSSTQPINQLAEANPVSEQTDCSSQPLTTCTHYKRGETVFIEKEGNTTKAMVFLSGLTFTISGRLNERDRTGISNAEQLTPVILRNGGKVFNRDITKVLDANFIMITSQKELEKDVKKISKPIIHAYRYKWPIVSKLFVLQSDKDKVIADINDYKLNLTNLDNAPASSLLQAKPIKQSELLGNMGRSAHRELKKALRQKRKMSQVEENNDENVPKQEPKRPANGYVTFLKEEFKRVAKEHPQKDLKDINVMISEKWRVLTVEEKNKFRDRGITDFQEKTEKWTKANQSRNN
ncbi:unnamed protein product, partial [Porites lobata]